MCLPEGSLQVYRHGGRFDGEAELQNPPNVIFLNIFLVFFPMLALQAQRYEGWSGEDPHSPPPLLYVFSFFLFFQLITTSVVLWWNLLMNLLDFFCPFLIHPHIDQSGVGPTPFWTQNKGRGPWSRSCTDCVSEGGCSGWLGLHKVTSLHLSLYWPIRL